MRSKFVTVMSVVLSFGLAHETSAGRFYREAYHITMLNQLQVEGPCVASLISQPATSCIQWEPNVTAFPSYDSSRRLVFSGSADHFLHVNDFDTGRPLAKIVTEGRVVTKPVFSTDKALVYFGTDKGKFNALDAYSFKLVFSLDIDSKVNNNMSIVDDLVTFTSSVGTVYAVDGKTGAIIWQIAQPLTKDRLRIAHQSTIFSQIDEEASLIVVPHSDGYVSVIDAKNGKLKKKIDLGIAQAHSFPDIVAPLVMLKNRLWVASHDMGVAIIDLAGLRIREQIDINGVLQLVTDGTAVFMATTDAIYRMNEDGNVVWKNDISTIKSRMPRAAFPFDNFAQGAKRIFFGNPTGMLVEDKRLVLSYSLGSVGVFDKTSGRLLGSAGHSVGISAIEQAEPSRITAISKRGSLMKLQAN